MISGVENDSGYSISPEELTTRPSMAGFLNLIHPNRVQVLGREEVMFLRELDEGEISATISKILSSQPLAIIVGDGLDPPPVIVDATARLLGAALNQKE